MSTWSARRIFVSLLFCGCLPQKTGSTCGPGTHDEDGVCVADAPAGDDTGEPTGEGGGSDGGGSEGGGDGGSEGGTDTGAEGGGGDSGSDGSGTDGGGSDGGSEGGGDGGSDSGASGDYEVCASGGAPYTDLQDAIDDASDGDTIRVCSGTYSWVEIDRLELTLEGEDADTTFIDGDIHAGIAATDSTLVLSGFSIKGARNSDISAQGLYLKDSSATVTDVIFEGSADSGYTTLMDASDVTFSDVTFRNNQASGLVLSLNSGSVMLRHSQLYDNTGASDSVLMLYVDRGVTAEVSNNLFYAQDGTSTSGGGIHLYSTSDAWVYNNVFYQLPGYCGVLIAGEGVNFQNNIVMKGSGYTLCLNTADIGTVEYNLVEGYSSPYGFKLDATNLDVAPAFTDPDAGDFTLDAGFSEAIDAGNPLSGYNDPDGTRNDLGAYGGPLGSAW